MSFIGRVGFPQLAMKVGSGREQLERRHGVCLESVVWASGLCVWERGVIKGNPGDVATFYSGAEGSH